MRRFTSIFAHTADFGHHTAIVLEGAPRRMDHALRLFIEDEELKLRRRNNDTWTPAQHEYVPCFFITNTFRWLCVCRGVTLTSKMLKIKVESLYRDFKEEIVLIDVQAIFNSYWRSTKHECTVWRKSSSPTSPRISDHEAQGASISGKVMTGIIVL